MHLWEASVGNKDHLYGWTGTVPPRHAHGTVTDRSASHTEGLQMTTSPLRYHISAQAKSKTGQSKQFIPWMFNIIIINIIIDMDAHYCSRPIQATPVLT